MTKFQETVSDLQRLANGKGPEADKARRALAAAGKLQPTSNANIQAIARETVKTLTASAPSPEMQVTRHSPHAGLLDDAFGTGAAARGPRNEGTRTILSPPPLRRG